MAGLVDDPDLSRQFDSLPPRSLMVDGVPRNRNREVGPEEAVRLAERGLRCFVLAFGFGSEVTAEELAEVVAEHRSHFDGMGAGHPPEAWALVYGRQHPTTGENTRIVVVCVLHVAESWR